MEASDGGSIDGKSMTYSEAIDALGIVMLDYCVGFRFNGLV